MSGSSTTESGRESLRQPWCAWAAVAAAIVALGPLGVGLAMAQSDPKPEAAAVMEVKAILAGHAVVPASASVPPPRDAGAFFSTAGKFAAANRQRQEKLGAIEGITFVGDPKHPRKSGGALPIKGQSVQGFSGIVWQGGNRYLLLTDNGFGSKVNSPDALLMVHVAEVDWSKGSVKLGKTTFLHDPDRRVPFQIQNENSSKRYLTGADFDLESIQVVNGEWWLGEEFGPYVLRVSSQGRVLEVIETVVDGKPIRSPDHYTVGRLPNYPGEAGFEARRSGGFEPMARSVDGKTLYPMFEWPLWDPQAKAQEARQGKPFTRILELDVATRQYRARQWRYGLEAAGHVVSDFQMIDANTGIVIERDDNTEGQSPACPGEPRADCFTRPAKFKRLYKIDLSQTDAEGFVRKLAYVDLTTIENPQGLAKLGPNGPVFSAPHLGPEGITLVEGRYLVLVNDNNFPFSSGRTLGRPDDNELMLLDVKALIDAR